jgi:ubiquinol-cytochrome c reductase cytochrome c1 subunit
LGLASVLSKTYLRMLSKKLLKPSKNILLFFLKVWKERAKQAIVPVQATTTLGAFLINKRNAIFKGLASCAALIGVTTTILFMKGGKVKALTEELKPPHYPWNHRFPWQSFDHMSIRRGFQVYQMVCSNCHALTYLSYRNLVNVAFTEEEVKAMAAEVEVEDGPNEDGEMFMRPGEIKDRLPKPYANEQAARAANNGAYPAELSTIIKARPHHEDYVFALLTGYKEPPPGVTLKEGQYYNPYFPGGKIAMPQQLHPGIINFEDGTEASISQLAKDITTFLAWASEPTLDEQHRLGLKALFLGILIWLPLVYYNRLKWMPIKNRQIQFLYEKKKKPTVSPQSSKQSLH